MRLRRRRLRVLPRLRIVIIVIMAAVTIGMVHSIWPLLAYSSAAVDTFKRSPLTSESQHEPLAGLAVTDITPPIGIPKFGYSAWSRPADGFRTRLKARAFYLKAADSTPVMLVQLDLGSGSLPLHYAVAERIAEHTDIPAHGLALLSTHTHSGPGQYLGSDFYNLFGSNQPGFDPALFEFLVSRISAVIIEAYTARQPSRVAIGQTQVWGATRNRSMAAWRQNRERPGDPQHPEAVAALSAYQAINPTMTMLRIDQRDDNGRYYPAGALSWYSIHGTGIAPFTRPYHADVWHWFSQRLSDALSSPEHPFIHGVAQATHGDNTPAWRNGARGDNETQRIGEILAAAAYRLHQSLTPELTDTWQLASASREVNLLDSLHPDETSLCPRAVIGTTLAGAAKGDEVFPLSYVPPFKAGSSRRVFTDGCHGNKRHFFSFLQRALPERVFPHRALVQVFQINELVVVPLPWEVTYQAGERIVSALKPLFPPETPVVVSSLANGYLGYAVTPEEYRAQLYEGGHTLYGPQTLPYILEQSQRLATELIASGLVDDIPERSSFRLRENSFFDLQTPERPFPRLWLSTPHYDQGDWIKDAHWQAKFRGEPARYLALHQPLLQVSCDGGPPFVVNDDSGDLELRHLKDRRDYGEYLIRWYVAPERLLDQQGEERAAIDCDITVFDSASGEALTATLSVRK